MFQIKKFSNYFISGELEMFIFFVNTEETYEIKLNFMHL